MTVSLDALSVEKLPPLPALLPHAGKMLLIDRLEAVSEDRVSVSAAVTADCPLLDANGALPAYALIEYMAQGVATYAGIQHFRLGQRPHIGFLLGSRKLTLHTDQVAAGSRVRIDVIRQYLEPNGLSAFECAVSLDGQRLAEAVIKGFEPPDVAAFLAERAALAAGGDGK